MGNLQVPSRSPSFEFGDSSSVIGHWSSQSSLVGSGPLPMTKDEEPMTNFWSLKTPHFSGNSCRTIAKEQLAGTHAPEPGWTRMIPPRFQRSSPQRTSQSHRPRHRPE